MENTKKVLDVLKFIQNLEMTSLEIQMLLTELAEISDRMDGWFYS